MMVEIICSPAKKGSCDREDVSGIEKEMKASGDLSAYLRENRWTKISDDIIIGRDEIDLIGNFFSMFARDSGIMVAVIEVQYGTTVSEDIPDMKVVDIWAKDYYSNNMPKLIDCMIIDAHGSISGGSVSAIVINENTGSLNSAAEIEGFIEEQTKMNYHNSCHVDINSYIYMKVPLYKGMKTVECEMSKIKCMTVCSAEVMHTRGDPGYSGDTLYFLCDELRYLYEEYEYILYCEGCNAYFYEGLTIHHDGDTLCEECFHCSMYREEAIMVDGYDELKELKSRVAICEPDINARGFEVSYHSNGSWVCVDIRYGLNQEYVNRSYRPYNAGEPVATINIPAKIKDVSDIKYKGFDDVMVFNTHQEPVEVFYDDPDMGAIVNDESSHRGMIVVFKRGSKFTPIFFSEDSYDDKYEMIKFLNERHFIEDIARSSVRHDGICRMYIHFSFDEYSAANHDPLIVEIDVNKHKNNIDGIKRSYARRLILEGK